MTDTATTSTEHRVSLALGALFTALDDEPDQVARLEQLRRASNMLRGETERTVPSARAAGATWQDVAWALGMNSKQAAQARYGG